MYDGNFDNIMQAEDVVESDGRVNLNSLIPYIEFNSDDIVNLEYIDIYLE